MSRSVVCVTGGGGYIGSWLVKKLLDRGLVVHATLRNLADEKTALLRELPGAAERLRLFQADIYDAETFEPAIAGCEFVFLVATPLFHDSSSTKYKDVTEAAVDAVRIVLRLCERSGTVRRVIHTASVVAASPLREDGSGFGASMNESCWTPLDHLPKNEFSDDFIDDYVRSKTLVEKELLRYNNNNNNEVRPSSSSPPPLEVVTLACALVGGDTIQPNLWSSLLVILSPLTGTEEQHRTLLSLQALLGCLPLAHVEDVCEAHAFCMEQASMAGRFLVAAGSLSAADIVDHFATRHPDLEIRRKEVTGDGVRVAVDNSKLVNMGFRYRYGVEETLDCTVQCAKRLGDL